MLDVGCLILDIGCWILDAGGAADEELKNEE